MPWMFRAFWPRAGSLSREIPLTLVEPIDGDLQSVVVHRTATYTKQAAEIFGRPLAPVNVLFDLRGRAAGIYRVRQGTREIRYNPWLFAKYFDDNLANTVPHEVAHYVVDCIYGSARTRPHGREWEEIMQAFGVKPNRTCDYDMTGIPTRTYRSFAYRCNCDVHQLTTRRHNQVVRGRRVYFCRKCRSSLLPENEIQRKPDL